MKRDSGEFFLLSGWEYTGDAPFERLRTRHWRATPGGFLQLIQDAWRNSATIKRAFAAFRPDTVYLNTVRSALLVLVCGIRFPGCRLILRDRDIRMPRLMPWLLRKGLRFEVSAISEMVAAKWHGVKVTIRENQLDEEAIRRTVPYQYPFKGPILIQVADFVPWKRHDLFLKMLAEAREKNPSIHGVIKGRVHTPEDERWLAEIRRLQSELGLDEALLIDTQDIPALPFIAGADTLVSCATDEPYGRAIQEARILGKRVIINS